LKKRLQIEVGDVSSDPELDVIVEAQAIMKEDSKYCRFCFAAVPDQVTSAPTKH
jgi:hypothetical protein